MYDHQTMWKASLKVRRLVFLLIFCYFLARARVVDTFLTFKINRRALLLNGIISHWRRDSSLEMSEDFSPIFYFKRRDTNFNLPQEYPDLHALHSFNAICHFWRLGKLARFSRRDVTMARHLELAERRVHHSLLRLLKFYPQDENRIQQLLWAYHQLLTAD